MTEPSPRPKSLRLVRNLDAERIWNALREKSPSGPLDEEARADILSEFGPEAAKKIDLYNSIMMSHRQED